MLNSRAHAKLAAWHKNECNKDPLALHVVDHSRFASERWYKLVGGVGGEAAEIDMRWLRDTSRAWCI